MPVDAEELYEASPCGYLSCAPDGTITRVNRTLLDWTGHARDDVVGRMRFVDLLTPASRIYHETHYAPLLRMQGAVQEVAFTVACADGRRLPVLVSSRLLAHRDGAPSVTLTSVFSATDRNRYERELLSARRRAEQAAERLVVLQSVAADLAASGDLAAVNGVLVRAGTATLGADACVVWLRDDRTHAMRPSAVGGSSAPGAPVHSLPLSHVAAADAPLLSGEVVALPVVRAAERFPLATEVLRGDGGGTVALAPVLEHGRLIAVLGLHFAGLQRLEPGHVDLLGALAGQAGLAIPRARLFEEQRDVAQTLQHSLLPQHLPTDHRFLLATCYRPASDGPAVGGDWYDAFWLDDHRLAVVVGDVVGRGVHAAAAMGQLRSAIRALTTVYSAPAQLLEALDRFVDGVPAASCATMVYAVLDVNTGRLEYACAGHPPPVLLDAQGEAAQLWAGRSVPLGVRVGDGHRTQAQAMLAPGARLLLYTDGLVERRDVPLDVRIDQLADEVARLPGATADDLVELVPGAMLPDPHASDDVCLLILSVPPGDGARTLDPATAGAAESPDAAADQ